VPVVVTLSGLRVNVHVPELGKPFKVTLPVATVQVGCVTVPTEGAVGVDGEGLMTKFGVAKEVQPDALVTV
jgi:hypothetical protein